MLSLNCAICGTKKSRFFKEQEANGLLSSLVKKANLKSKSYNRSYTILKV